MKPGSVMVDVAIDQGGCIETMDHTTTHSNPPSSSTVWFIFGAQHPGAVPRTSTFALTNATLPYALLLANKGFKEAVKSNVPLSKGVNVTAGKITYAEVAKAHNLPYTPLAEVLG